ncbi:MAG: guanylate kinase [Lachnospiraceae bacterium]
MGKIFCIMGKSASGKDTVYKKLLENTEISLKKIVPYTTRPIRAGETEGVEYHFTDEEGLSVLQKEGKVIEMRAYDTCCGVWKYFTADDGQIRDDGLYLVIGTLESYLALRNYFGEEQVCPLYIELEDGERLMRAFNREREQKEPKYAEVCRRFLADEEDFSEEKLQQAGIKKRFENTESDTTVEEILRYIKKEM